MVDLDSAKYSGMSDVELVEDRGCDEFLEIHRLMLPTQTVSL